MCFSNIPLSAEHEVSVRYNRTSLRFRTIAMMHNIYGGSTKLGAHIRIPFTNGEMRRCIGTTREGVRRIYGSLQRRRIVHMNGSVQTISDRSRSSVLPTSERRIPRKHAGSCRILLAGPCGYDKLETPVSFQSDLHCEGVVPSQLRKAR